MMNILLLGASGPTGQQVLQQALEHGDTVTALARHPETLEQFGQQVKVVRGDATSAEDLTKAMDGQDVIISTLGRGKALRAENLFTDAILAILQAASATGVHRLVWLSSFGVAHTYDSATFSQKAVYKTILRNIYANKAEAEKLLRASDLDYTIVYPTALTNGPATDTYRVGENISMKSAVLKVSRADVGHFMYRAARDAEWIGRDAVITSGGS